MGCVNDDPAHARIGFMNAIPHIQNFSRMDFTLRTLSPITFLLLISAGVTLHAAIQSAIFAFTGRRKNLYIVFAAMCLITTAYLMNETLYYSTASTSRASTILKWQFALTVTLTPVLFGFVATYTGQKKILAWQICLSLVAVLLLILNFGTNALDASVYAQRGGIRPDPAWGSGFAESVETFVGWHLMERLFTSAVLVWAIMRAAIMYRRGRQRSSLLLGCALVLLLIASIEGAAVDLGYSHFIYWGGISFLGVVLFMSMALGLEVRDQTRVLKATTDNLKQQARLHRVAEDRIRHMAYHDYLTGLPNRARLQELLAAAVLRHGRVGSKGVLIMLGLDDFKIINELLGHEFGDRLLRQVGARLLSAAHKESTPARLAGDEFILLLPDAGNNIDAAATHARHVARNVIDSLSQPFVIEGRSVDIGASAGIVVFPEGPETKVEILHHAEMALSRAKSYGRSGIQLYAAGMQQESNQRMELEKDMRLALGRDEFFICYQPQIGMSGEVVGAEALLRWRHPEKGIILPAVFIPIAEHSGLIRQIGDWVLQQTCQEISFLEQSVPTYRGHLSVNVSILQFMQSNYEESVERQLISSGINPERLMLEITESTFIHDVDIAISKINSLRAKGLRFSIDDFGTGYASLSYLRKLPVDELKIDQAFIRNLGADLRDSHLVETIIDIAKCMGLRVVAEGVESEYQRNALAAMNCWAFQGYYLAKPMDKHQFFTWVKGRNMKTLSHAML
jgi:diguanylate cyclase (GGDEF)-like protein